MIPQLIAINTEHTDVLNMVFKYSFNQTGGRGEGKASLDTDFGYQVQTKVKWFQTVTSGRLF